MKARYVDNLSFYHQIHFTWYDHPAQSSLSSVTFHNVIVFPCYHLYFNKLKAKYTEVKYLLKQSLFLHEYQIWWTVEWSWQCFTKRRIIINHVSRIRLKSSIFLTFTQHHVTTERNNVTQWLTAMRIDFKHISPLCLSTLCHEKQVIWTN